MHSLSYLTFKKGHFDAPSAILCLYNHIVISFLGVLSKEGERIYVHHQSSRGLAFIWSPVSWLSCKSKHNSNFNKLHISDHFVGLKSSRTKLKYQYLAIENNIWQLYVKIKDINEIVSSGPFWRVSVSFRKHLKLGTKDNSYCYLTDITYNYNGGNLWTQEVPFLGMMIFIPLLAISPSVNVGCFDVHH